MEGQRLDIAGSLADALAGGGVATLRYDKRGVGESEGEFLDASFHDEVTDAGAALDALRTFDETLGSIAVVGHSVGATVAMRLAGHPAAPDAYVFLAGAARPGEQVMAWQSRRIAETLPAPARWFGWLFERRQAVDRRRILASTTPTIRLRRQTMPAAWFRGYMGHDPAADLALIDRPVLAVTGRKDVQVDPADVATIGRLISGPFEGETPDDLTHLLRSDDAPPGLRAYPAQLQRPPDRQVVDRVATWVTAISTTG